MNRRKFGLALALGAGGVLSDKFVPHQKYSHSDWWKTVKPKALKKGDLIGLIAPSSSFDEERFEISRQNLREAGYKIKTGKSVLKRKGYLAGPDEDRLHDIHQMFADPKVKGIWCIRGGYGASRLLPKINYQLIASNPKVMAGFSDITALLNAFYLKTGLVGFHGPVAASEMNTYNKEYFFPLVENSIEYPFQIANSGKNILKGMDDAAYRLKTISPGSCIGRITGGNLSLLSAMAGTPYLDSFKGKIVFMEDVSERPYRIDRMLTQLLQATDLSKAAGIALGIFNRCEPNAGERSLSLLETLEDRLGNLGIPVVYGLSFGHVDEQFTFPLGIHAQVDATQKNVTLLESPVG